MAKKKEETQQKKWLLIHTDGGMLDNVVSTYDSEEDARAALDTLRMSIINSGCEFEVGDYHIEEAASALNVKDTYGVRYVVAIYGSSVKVKKKGKGKKGKKKVTQKIFAGIDPRPRYTHQERVNELAVTLEALNHDDYEVEAFRHSAVPYMTDEDATSISFRDLGKSFGRFGIVIKGDVKLTEQEVIAEFFKRIGM